MHGLINKAIQGFVSDSYGPEAWARTAQRAELGLVDFEAMLIYDDAVTWRILDDVATGQGKPREEVLEDIGTYLVSHPNVEALRRLLRFGGVDFVDFLHSLDDLPDRARLAVADLDLPALEMREHASHRFSLTCISKQRGYAHVMLGILRTMADDYGALVMLDYQGSGTESEVIEIILVQSGFTEGRSFDLGAGASV